jgi:hypothetical protein
MRARWLIVMLVVFLALLAGLAWAAHRVERAARSLVAYAGSERGDWVRTGEEERSFDAAGARQLTIENRVGDIKIVAGGPSVKVHAVAFARAGSEAARESGRVGVSCESDGRTGLRIRIPNQRDHTRVNLELQVPVTLAVTVANSVGSVDIERLTSAVTVDNGAGNITATDCAGPIDVHTGAGTIVISGARAGVSAATGAGDVRVDGARGAVDGHAGAGTVALTHIISDDVKATVGCGDVQVTMDAPFSGTMYAHTGMGTATVALRPGSRCRVATSVHIGSVSDDLPASVVSRSGPGLVDVSSGLGDVSVEKAD